MKSFLVITALLGALAVASAQVAKIPTGFTTLIRTAVEGNEGKLRTPEGLPFGAVFDENMKHITDKDGKKLYGDYPDSTTLHKVMLRRHLTDIRAPILHDLARIAVRCIPIALLWTNAWYSHRSLCSVPLTQHADATRAQFPNSAYVMN
jgi:hypothetical protein